MVEDTNIKETLIEETNNELREKIDELIETEKNNNRMLRSFYKGLCFALFFFVMLYYYTPLQASSVTLSVVYSVVAFLISCIFMYAIADEHLNSYDLMEKFMHSIKKINDLEK